ncbi:MAG: hypothetical protein AAF915_16375 [Cyanobacteria bacterium P01_D01_bin.50]
MTYTEKHSYEHDCECEFTFPIKLNIPITINPTVYINPVPVAKERLPVVIEPDLLLEPGVRSKAPACYAQNGYKKNLQNESVMQSAEIK